VTAILVTSYIQSYLREEIRATRLEISQGHQTIRCVRYSFLLVCYSNFVPKARRF